MEINQHASELVFFVNGKKVVETRPDPKTSLLEYLRHTLLLSGTKLSCGEGACGSCTVMVSRYDRTAEKLIHKAVMACLVPVCSMHGCAVTTVEGVGSLRSGLHPIQDRLVENHGIQCGFCTPGMVMSMYALLRMNASPSQQEIETALDGNLCRCTGYRPILESFGSFSKEFTCGLGEKCCKNRSKEEKCNEPNEKSSEEYLPYDPTQEPIFPSELQVSDKYDQENLMYEGEDCVWYRPASLPACTALRKTHPDAVLVGGFTSPVARASSGQGKKVMISLERLGEGHIQEQTTSGLRLGACLTVNEAASAMRSVISQKSDHNTRGLMAILTLLERFGSNQIRNMATLGGSLVTNLGNSDIIVAMVAADVQLTLLASDGEEKMIALREWCSSSPYAPSIDDQMILTIMIPFTSSIKAVVCSSELAQYPRMRSDITTHQLLGAYDRLYLKPDEYVFTYKQSWRRAMDRAIVNAGLSVTLAKESKEIEKATLCFGGVASSGIILARKTAENMIGKKWEDSIINEVSKALSAELNAIGITNKTEYRCTLALGFFLKFFHSVNNEYQPDGSTGDLSSCVVGPSSFSQVWEEVPADQDPSDAVGQPKPHVSAKQLATGEGLFYSDIPKREDELFLAMVRSTKAHAEIVSVDTSAALSMPGVVGCVGHEDVPGANGGHGIYQDELIFAVDKVECIGQVICGVLAGSEQQARDAARMVKVTYKELPPIITIQEAIKEQSFYSNYQDTVSRGDTSKAFDSADHVIEGTARIGAQEHFYMETQFTYMVPLKETGEYEGFVCTQALTSTQEGLSKALNIPRSKIVLRQKRIGGSFGGKEVHSTVLGVLPSGVAAYKYQRPVRCQLSREEDITTTGGRHPFTIYYKVGFKQDGEITAVDYQMYSNGGSVQEMSTVISTFGLKGCEGAYRIPNIHANVKTCKTNTPSPTSFRAFGCPQTFFASEVVINNIAAKLNLPPEKVRDKNLFSDGDPHIGDLPVSGNMRKCWDQLMQQSDVQTIRQELDAFNRENRWKKRGVAVIPTVYAVGFPFPAMFQNSLRFLLGVSPAYYRGHTKRVKAAISGLANTKWHGGAQVIVYQDGSVLLSHGGVEIGQGINTKMIQIASRELGIPCERIHTAEAATNVVPNTTTTCASTGTDLNGPAVMDACRQLKKRLAPMVEANPTGSWDEWVLAAYYSCISLSAAGYYMLREKDTPTGKWTDSFYYTYGVACSTVEVDCLTGDHAILQTDIVMDVGRSLNPGIDIGQIEGGFMQGRGLYTMEETFFSPEGYMETRSAETYKIPTVADIPKKFKVTLLKGSDGDWKRPVYSSKGIGEPPLALGMSVYFAIYDAVEAARKDHGLSGAFDLDSPATAERIRMACSDNITTLVTGSESDFKPEWRA